MATDKYEEYVDNLKMMEVDTGLLIAKISSVMVSFSGIVLTPVSNYGIELGIIKDVLIGAIVFLAWIVFAF